uniref:Uncharacterized protein n=1 Tax=Timema tahoe TaxID=61484 RepID=A0A7R9IU19_9NEOP|nr:unnamed protein product [Timema tahoe]
MVNIEWTAAKAGTMAEQSALAAVRSMVDIERTEDKVGTVAEGGAGGSGQSMGLCCYQDVPSTATKVGLVAVAVVGLIAADKAGLVTATKEGLVTEAECKLVAATRICQVAAIKWGSCYQVGLEGNGQGVVVVTAKLGIVTAAIMGIVAATRISQVTVTKVGLVAMTKVGLVAVAKVRLDTVAKMGPVAAIKLHLIATGRAWLLSQMVGLVAVAKVGLVTALSAGYVCCYQGVVSVTVGPVVYENVGSGPYTWNNLVTWTRTVLTAMANLRLSLRPRRGFEIAAKLRSSNSKCSGKKTAIRWIYSVFGRTGTVAEGTVLAAVR